MTSEALDGLGDLDILVNNAGACFHNDSWHASDDEWRRSSTSTSAHCGSAASRPRAT